MKILSWDKVQVNFKIHLIIICTAIIAWGLYAFLLMPQFVYLNGLTEQYHVEGQRVKGIEGYLFQHPNPKQHLVELDNKMLQVDKKLPDIPDIGVFVVEIEKLSRDSGLQLKSIKSGQIASGEGYIIYDFDILISGTFVQTLQFLSKVEQGVRFININNISMQSNKNGLETKLFAKIYSYGVPDGFVGTKTKTSNNEK